MVVDPLSLTALTATALTGGITFLYGQATEILRRRHERKQARARGEQPAIEPIPVGDSGALEGTLAPLRVDPEAEDQLADVVAKLRRELSDYGEGLAEVDPSDRRVLSQVAALREALESIVGQRITFRDEQREPSGTPVVHGSADVGAIRAALTVVETEDVLGGRVEGTLRADVIEGDADVKVVKTRNVGSPATPRTTERP